MKIAVLGGSFDPPHNGHLFAAKSLLKQRLCQKIILVPCLRHPFGKKLSKAAHRLAMTRLFENENIEVSDIEMLREETSYTIDTLNALKTQFPKDYFVWIIGSDQVKDFKKWKGWKEIKEKFGLIVVPRKVDISSSEIKKRIKEGKDIEGFVPKEVGRYIIQHGLYL